MGADLVKFYRVTDTMYSEQAEEEVLNLDVALCSPPPDTARHCNSLLVW